jgi:U3 small nucleolar ribonucleoprotein component
VDFQSLCLALDTLCNYHYTPPAPEVDLEVASVAAPAISMEEVIPTGVSEAILMAPEEIAGKKRGR